MAMPLLVAALLSIAAVTAIAGLISHAQSSRDARAAVEAIVGSAALVLTLLLGFAFFFRRAFRSRMAAETLAEALRRSEAHLERAQGLAGIGSWEWHLNDGAPVVTFSAEQARLHGWTRSEPPRSVSEVFELIAAEDRERVLAALTEAFTDGTPVDLQYRVHDPESRRLIHLHGTIEKDAQGHPNGMIGTCQDVTERFRRAEAERANRAKDEFISRMSHELRTPLNAILGFGQLLAMADLDERQRVDVEHILTAGRHLLGLIDEILDMSRIESGHLRLSLEPVHVGAVVTEVVDLVKPMASARGIAVAARLTDRELWVTADEQRLKQVLLNLLSNGVKYNREGGHVDVSASLSEAGRVRVVVADDGPGIEPALRERLFRPFERLGAERTAVEGTGLGLALSRGMIEAMAGTIAVESEPGHGAAFTIELAAEESTPVPDRAPEEIGLELIGLGTKLKVLCVEDNPSNLLLIEQIFRYRPAVQLLTATDGVSGAEMIREHLPDLVLLDLNLPDIGGEEILIALKADPTTSRIPVVVLSADATAGQFERLISGGAYSYLTKPVDVAELLRVVDAAVTDRGEGAATPDSEAA